MEKQGCIIKQLEDNEKREKALASLAKVTEALDTVKIDANIAGDILTGAVVLNPTSGTERHGNIDNVNLSTSDLKSGVTGPISERPKTKRT